MKKTKVELQAYRLTTGGNEYRITKMVNTVTVITRGGVSYRVGDRVSHRDATDLCEQKNLDVTIISGD